MNHFIRFQKMRLFSSNPIRLCEDTSSSRTKAPYYEDCLGPKQEQRRACVLRESEGRHEGLFSTCLWQGNVTIFSSFTNSCHCAKVRQLLAHGKGVEFDEDLFSRHLTKSTLKIWYFLTTQCNKHENKHTRIFGESCKLQVQ